MNLQNYKEFRRWFRRWIKGKSDETKRKYERVLISYCEFRDMNPEELIDEAEEDWNRSGRGQGVVESKIKDFQEHMEEEGYNEVTVKSNLLCIVSFYSANNFPQDVKTPKASPTNKAWQSVNPYVDLSGG